MAKAKWLQSNSWPFSNLAGKQIPWSMMKMKFFTWDLDVGKWKLLLAFTLLSMVSHGALTLRTIPVSHLFKLLRGNDITTVQSSIWVYDVYWWAMKQYPQCGKTQQNQDPTHGVYCWVYHILLDFQLLPCGLSRIHQVFKCTSRIFPSLTWLQHKLVSSNRNCRGMLRCIFGTKATTVIQSSKKTNQHIVFAVL